MQQLLVNGDVGYIQQHILFHQIVQEERVEISSAAWIKLSKLAEKVVETVRCDSMFVNLMKTFLNFCQRVRMQYNEKFVATHIVSTVKDIIGSSFQTEMRSQSYCRYIWVARMLLEHENVLALEKSRYADDASPTSSASSVSVTLVYTTRTLRICKFSLEPQVTLRRTYLPQLRSTHLHSIAARKYFRGRTVLGLLITVHTLLRKFLSFKARSYPIRAHEAFFCCKCVCVYVSAQIWTREQKEVWKTLSEFLQRWIMQNVQKCFTDSNTTQPESLEIE